jgi:DNA-binding beta-propeller fold protein YncE
MSRSVLSIASLLLLLALPSLADEAPDDEGMLGSASSAPRAEAAPLATKAPQIAPAVAPAGRLTPHLVRHVEAGKQPTTCAISKDGATLYVACRGDNSVSVFDANTMDARAPFKEVGYSAWGLAEKDLRTLLVSNWAGSGIAIIDTATGQRTGEIPSGMKPSYLALSPDHARVYSAGNFGGEAAIGDIATRKLVRSLDVGRRPSGVAVSPDGRWLYVAVCESNEIARIDLKNEVVLDRMGVPLATMTNLLMSPDGSTLLACGKDDRLLLVDVASGKAEKVKVGADPSSVAVTPDGTLALVSNYGASSVTLVDLATREPYAQVATGPGPIHVETDGKRFWTCNDRAGTVSFFRLETPEQAALRATAAGQ